MEICKFGARPGKVGCMGEGEDKWATSTETWIEEVADLMLGKDYDMDRMKLLIEVAFLKWPFNVCVGFLRVRREGLREDLEEKERHPEFPLLVSFHAIAPTMWKKTCMPDPQGAML
ncbi:hypothetical protein SLEP1_g44076 [Rubroshorea leprosula]|uniref:Uncharacterized protein n=1 Tax=Rubroshorea leprosula TaxID=152421 RepID=A0AAV5LF21_9ROSI|nr:hypothetical protein SLEP1_g44076 [Rubroshorea leprosula]